MREDEDRKGDRVGKKDEKERKKMKGEKLRRCGAFI